MPKITLQRAAVALTAIIICISVSASALSVLDVCLSVKAKLSLTNSSNVLFDSLLADCMMSEANSSDEAANLGSFIAAWLRRQSEANVSGFDVSTDGWWLPVADQAYIKILQSYKAPHPLMQCYAEFNCTDRIAENVVKTFTMNLLMFWHWSYLASLPSSNATALPKPETSLPFNSMCLEEDRKCCFGFTLTIRDGGPVNAFYYTGDISDGQLQGETYYRFMRCYGQIIWSQKRKLAEAEFCSINTLQNSAQLSSNAAHNMTTFESCYENKLKAHQLRYRLAFSSFGLLEATNLLNLRLAGDHCEFTKNISCQPGSQSSTLAEKLKLRSIFSNTTFPIMVAQQSIIFLLNLALLFAIGQKPAGLQRRPAIFLCNMTLTNLLFFAAETLQLILSTAQIHAHCFLFNDHESLRKLHCCGGYSDFIVNGFDIAVANCLDQTHSVLVAFLLLLRITAQYATMLNFVAFGLFQLLPLIWPFDPPRFLRYPKSVIGVSWALACLMSVATNVFTLVDYKQMQRSLEDPYEVGGISSPAELPESKLNDQVSHIAVGAIVEIVLMSTVLFAGQLAYGCILAMVCKLSLNRDTLQAGQGGQLMKEQTRKCLLTIGIAMAATLLTALSSVYLCFVAYMSSSLLEIENSSASDFYGTETLEWYITASGLARISLACEPIISPVLMMIRYQPLRIGLKNGLRQLSVRLKRALAHGSAFGATWLAAVSWRRPTGDAVVVIQLRSLAES